MRKSHPDVQPANTFSHTRWSHSKRKRMFLSDMHDNHLFNALRLALVTHTVEAQHIIDEIERRVTERRNAINVILSAVEGK